VEECKALVGGALQAHRQESEQESEGTESNAGFTARDLAAAAAATSGALPRDVRYGVLNIARHVIGCRLTRELMLQNALDEIASNIR